MKISLGAARGIAHNVAEGGVKFAHGNIKSSNALLTQDLDACVTDFDLALLITSAATTSCVVGYRAPEVIETRKITQKSDVYSFGVLLLETLTGKAPIQSPGCDDVVDLPRCVQFMNVVRHGNSYESAAEANGQNVIGESYKNEAGTENGGIVPSTIPTTQPSKLTLSFRLGGRKFVRSVVVTRRTKPGGLQCRPS